jgi:uncharacterized membrane protein YedE/YeeE
MMINLIFLFFGVSFGFLLSGARATDYNTIARMFLFADFHLAGVMMTAIVFIAVGSILLQRAKSTALIGCAVELRPKPMHRWTLAAGLIFGAGWALTGA